MMQRIHFHGRLVGKVTSEEGQKHYYEHLDHWRDGISENEFVISSTPEDAAAYLQLKSVKDELFSSKEPEDKEKRYQFNIYDSRYDWRPHKTGESPRYGLATPDGRSLLPEKYADIFTQFDAINQIPEFLPVFDGEAWGLVSLSSPSILMADFRYKTILLERWERQLYFVQDKKTLKWGAYKVTSRRMNRLVKGGGEIYWLEQIMPPIADEIYEDELVTENTSTPFWMTSSENKIGFLTPFGYSQIIYDTYETDDANFAFRLIRHGFQNARRANYGFVDSLY